LSGQPSNGEGAPSRRVRIWDLPTRLFHWLLVVLIGFMWWSGKAGRMDLHMLAGSVVLGLLVFRILWGFIGGSTARFAYFIKGPRAVMSYLNGRAAHVVGHNPLGGWSVATMLLLLTVQVGLGLFASDPDGLDAGPLSHFVNFDSAVKLGHNHDLLFNILLAFIGLHVAAILFYAVVKRDNLVSPMLHGSGRGEEVELIAAPRWRFALAAAIAILAALVLTLWL
jgi:cytochrome b